MNREQISKIVDGWIVEEDLPVNPRLKVIRKFDDVYPEDWDEDEFEAYWEFIAKGLAKDYEPLLALPKPEKKCEFWPFQIDEYGYDNSPFTTTDFKYRHPYKFNKERYKVNKVFERVKDLAIAYSSSSHRDGKKNMYDRFRKLVEIEFRDWALWIQKALRETKDPETLRDLRRKLFKLSSRIQRCNEIWRKYAYWK
jgi:hypothetical protein